jgi:hypothetical protein
MINRRLMNAPPALLVCSRPERLLAKPGFSVACYLEWRT